MSLKKAAGLLHLWLGLLCGLVVFISMTAAAVFVWDQELTALTRQDALYVKPQGKALPIQTLLESARKNAPGKNISRIEMYNDAERTVIFSTYEYCDSCSGWTIFSELNYWNKICVNPYTGVVTGDIDMLHDWVQISRRLHQNLLLRHDVGHYIVGICTFIVLILVITGIILWFPKNKAALKQRFSIKWNARWRRVNYDIHNVGGFYLWLLIVIFAVTGLVWTFEWWENGIYRMFGSEPEAVWVSHTPLQLKGNVSETTLDKVFHQFDALRPDWKTADIDIPQKQNDTVTEISVYLGYDGESDWDELDVYHFHPETGIMISSQLHEHNTTAAKWRYTNYSIHVGSIYGLYTKIPATFAALFLASLPVTGFLIWWGRKKKPKKIKSVKTS